MGTYMKLRSGDLLVEFMRLRPMNGSELARAVGKSKQFISQLRTGADDTCKPETAYRIARALNVPIEALWEERHPVSTLPAPDVPAVSTSGARRIQSRKTAAA